MKLTTVLSLAILSFKIPETLAAGSVCSSGIYAALAPLETYAPAVNYCQGQANKVAVTTTVTASPKAKRVPVTTGGTKITTTSATTLKTSTTSSKDAKASSWSSLVAQASAVVATFCSCAGYPATTTVCHHTSSIIHRNTDNLRQHRPSHLPPPLPRRR